MNKNDLTSGSMLRNLISFSVPYLIACFLQTFYGMADLFLVGQYGGADSITAVSVGSQVTHMLTVVIVGLAMGTAVAIGRASGAGDSAKTRKAAANSILIFVTVAAVLTAVLLLGCTAILRVLETPGSAFAEAKSYLMICFGGVPFIVAYNLISSIFRGMGDTRHPMVFVFIAGVLNLFLDYLFIGPLGMGAAGAALATITAQGVSVLIALLAMKKLSFGIRLTREDFRPSGDMIRELLIVGFPIAVQDGLIQVSFLVITAIANSRGVETAAAVGIVEKIISFLFLVPSAMLSSVSAITAQNIGAGKHESGRKVLRYGIWTVVLFGLLVMIVCQAAATGIVAVFAKNEAQVAVLGGQYLRSYSWDCIFAGVHFCFSGYFSAYGKSWLSFVHNLASILLVRIPGAYLASLYFPENLYPMGLAAPAGSLLSGIICLAAYLIFRKAGAFGSMGRAGAKE